MINIATTMLKEEHKFMIRLKFVSSDQCKPISSNI